jgi:uncharacterized protein YdcH (DUF465 family)
MSQESLIERLMAENEEFRRLRLEHQDYDRELETLRGTSALSAEQQWRVTELKKLKLMAKDRMEAIIRQARVTQPERRPVPATPFGVPQVRHAPSPPPQA